MSQRIDMVGRVFGNWKVLTIDYSKDRGHGAYWICQCACGSIKSVHGENLRRGKSTSCGCRYRTGLRRDNPGLSNTWKCMKSRCYNKKHTHYNAYGGRGIKICDEWKNDFQAFYDWAMSNGYKTGLTIDRIDMDGNYEPSNCQWITKSENSRKAVQDRREKNGI